MTMWIIRIVWLIVLIEGQAFSNYSYNETFFEDWSNSPVGTIPDSCPTCYFAEAYFKGISCTWMATWTRESGATCSVLGNKRVQVYVPPEATLQGGSAVADVGTFSCWNRPVAGMPIVPINHDTDILFYVDGGIIQRDDKFVNVSLGLTIKKNDCSGGELGLRYIVAGAAYCGSPYIVIEPGQWTRNLYQDVISAWSNCGLDFESWKYQNNPSGQVYIAGVYIGALTYGNSGAWGEVGSISIVPKPALVVAVDIKPTSCPNPLNVKSKGVLPVAILGSEDFDVAGIDVASIRLAGIAPIRSSYEDVARPVSDANECECSTEGPDGFPDLTLKFETQKIVEAIGEVNNGDELTLELTGVLSDETSIEGSDCIIICNHKPLNRADFNGDGIGDMADFAAFSENWLQSSIVE